ncbi:MAG TPA: hypothetical protein VFI38_13365 [Candidatus Acidoferrum sp.]|nr:hypothetical protein [Candidatus Acidoferrum sp.]
MTTGEMMGFGFAVLGLMQGLSLFIVSDLRDRIMRLENREMKATPSGG